MSVRLKDAQLPTYQVIKVHLERHGEIWIGIDPTGRRVTLTGRLTAAQHGSLYLIAGSWTAPQTFHAILASPPFPHTPTGIELFLSMGLIRGIGPGNAKRLVQAFGARTLEVIAHHPDELRTVPGIGPVKAQEFHHAWQRCPQVQIQTIALLMAGGCGPHLSQRLWEEYKTEAVIKVLENPYRLIDEFERVGFKTADEIALALNYDATNPWRIRAALTYVLMEKGMTEGHTALPLTVLCTEAQKLLNIDPHAILHITQTQDSLVKVQLDGVEGRAVRRYHQAESIIAKTLLERKAYAHRHPADPLPDGLEYGPLDNTQQQAVRQALTEPLSLITGGPGTGKTATIGTIIANCQKLGWTYQITAPTGRAAKRIQELTGHPATTIHRWLKWRPGVMPDRPEKVNLLIIDEVSMVSINTASVLFRLLHPDTRVVLVGDADQLPAVEPGALLRDLLESGEWPVTRLHTLYRQNANSLININAQCIRQGHNPRLIPWDPPSSANCRYLAVAEPADIVQAITKLLVHDLPQQGYRRSQVMVLTPQHSGPIGTTALNTHLQHTFNPQGRFVPGTKGLRVGDPVLHTRNSPDLDRYNGDIGTIISAIPLRVQYPDGITEYKTADRLQIAYAMTVHKAQGSEAPVVICVMHQSHYYLLTRQLLYTGLTRGQQLAILVGTAKAIHIAKDKGMANVRWTCLPELIRDLKPAPPQEGLFPVLPLS